MFNTSSIRRLIRSLVGRAPRLLVTSLAAVHLVSACTELQPPERASVREAVPGTSEIELRLDSLIYATGQDVHVVLDFGELPPPEGADVLLVGSKSEDVEAVRMVRDHGNRLVSVGRTSVGGSDPIIGDGTLSLSAGEMFTAFYFVDSANLDSADVDLVADFGLLVGEPHDMAPVEIDPEAAMSEHELNPVSGGKRVGTILPRGGLPVQVAVDELLLFTGEQDVLDAFLEESDGTILRSEPLFDEEGEESDARVYLVRVDPLLVGRENLEQLRAFLGEETDLLLSNEEVAGIYASALHYMLEGYPVAVNPKVQFHGAPTVTATERANAMHNMVMKRTNPNDCVPGSGAPCVLNVPAMWAFNALWDGDQREIQVAVLDQGFADMRDIRAPRHGARLECDMTDSRGPTCAPGAAIGAPTVGNSFFGDKTWHGTGVASVIGGIVNNGIHAAGVGGQVAVPAFYKYDLAGYAFEIGAGFRRATDDGAACINISGGYPCNILTNIGPDFDICSEGGRGELCGAIAAALGAAVGAACGASGLFDFFVPGSGGIICGVAVAGATFSAATCASTLQYGDVAGVMQSGASYATIRGVPIVTSAGNRLEADTLPPVVRDYVDLSDRTVDSWRMVPASFRNVIAVGAVDSETLDNLHFYGDLVDVWAPIRSRYFGPQDTTDPTPDPAAEYSIGGTSAAAPYVAGVIAAMQAINPELDPRTYDPEADFGISRARRREIPRRIVELLSDPANSLSNDELVSIGYTDQPEERRVLVNPLLALQAAASERSASPFFDLAAQGFDASLGFSELTDGGIDDTSSGARPIDFSIAETGTILSIPAEGAATSPQDVDWYTFRMPEDSNPDVVFETSVEIEYPTDPSADTVELQQTIGGTARLIRRGTSSVYTVVAAQSQQVWIKLGSDHGDNVYKVTVSEPEVATPFVEITRPRTPELCSIDEELEARAQFELFPEMTIPDAAIEWFLDDAFIGAGRVLEPAVLPLGVHDLSVRALGDVGHQDIMEVTVSHCVGLQPRAEIRSPAPGIDAYADETDSNGPYIELSLSAIAYDRDPGGTVTVRWTTDRGDLQPGGDATLATSPNATVRLYTPNCGSVEHTLMLTVQDDDGNIAEDVVVVRAGGFC